MVSRKFALAALLVLVPGFSTPPLEMVESVLHVAGRVTDAATGAPITDVQVHLVGHNVGAITRAEGRYAIQLGDDFAGREVTVRFQRIGYADAATTVVLKSGINALDAVLTTQSLGLDEAVVTGTAGASRRREVGNSGQSGRSTQPRQPAPQSKVVAGSAADAAAAVAAIPLSRAPAPAPAGPTAPSTTASPPAFAPSVYSVAPPAISPVSHGGGGYGSESYARIEENGFLSASKNALSTFSIDVDRASYANVRRFILGGHRPPVDAVRIEEMVNYFTYADRAPSGRVPISVTTEVSAAPWQPAHKLVRIAMRSRPVSVENLPPNNLVFLIDVSGSMATEDKLPLVKKSLRMLVQQLREQDRVAIVVYAGAAGLVLPSTPGSAKGEILHAIEHLEAGGSTAGGAGIRLAYHVAAVNHMPKGNNRVILATDGDFNVGASSDAEMVQLIEEKRAQGTYLTVLGFGTGNLKDSKMEQIADHGNGNFAYIDSEMEAKKALVTEMGGTLLTVAQDVKVQVEFNPARVAAYRLIGYENRLLANEDFNNDAKDAGEIGAGHSVVALYEVVPVGVHSRAVPDVDPLRYQDPGPTPSRGRSAELLFVKVRYKEPGAAESQLLTQPVLAEAERPSADFRFAAAVAAWGMLLRDSDHVGDFTLADVSRLARESVGEDLDGYRKEFVELVDHTRRMELIARRR